jgi:ankyrin repeat protein
MEHKSDDVDSDDDMVLHASISESLLDKRNSTLKVKPVSTKFKDDEIENDLVMEKESKVKPKLKEKTKAKKTKGEVLTPDAALDFMIKERQEFDFECAALRAENDQLREGLEKYSHLTPSKTTARDSSQDPEPEPEVVEKIVIKKILDPNGKKYKQDAEKLSLENEKLKQQHLEMEALLKQQRQLAEEAKQHPISKRKSVTTVDVPETNTTTVPHLHQPEVEVEVVKKKSDKKSKKSSKKEMIQKSLTPVSSNNCSTFPMLLWKGAILWKIPYNGRGVPERRLVMIKRAPLPGKKAKAVTLLMSEDSSSSKKHTKKEANTYIVNPPTIIWANPEKSNDLKNARELVLFEGAHIVLGHQSPAFWKSKNRGTPLPPEQFCFSIITNSRSLDLAAESIEEVVAWKNALHMLLVMMSPNQDWAIHNLVKKQPVWHHEELENHASQKQKKKKEEIVVTVGDSSARNRDEDYENASNMAKQSSLKDQMFAATRSADYNKLENILKTKISVNLMENADSDTILMIACRAGLDKICRLCLDYGARNDPHPDFGQTALHCAVESRSYKCARVLLEVAAASQADSIIANLRDSSDQTPLHISANFGDTKMSTILCSHGADIDSVDSKNRAPLHLCAGSGHKICLSLLLDSGGDIFIDMGDGQGNTPLHYAAENGHLTCCRLLLETAANPIARNIHQQTPYNLASLRGHQKICLLLLDYQDSVAQSSYDSSPPRDGLQRTSSLKNLSSPFPQKIERNISLPGSTAASSPLFYNQQGQGQGQHHQGHLQGHQQQKQQSLCALPRPHSARTHSTGSSGSDSTSPLQYAYTSRDRTHTSHRCVQPIVSIVVMIAIAIILVIITFDVIAVSLLLTLVTPVTDSCCCHHHCIYVLFANSLCHCVLQFDARLEQPCHEPPTQCP